MPLNLLKRYSNLLDIGGLTVNQCKESLKGIFDRDITNNPSFKFRTKLITPTPKDGEIPMETLYSHLTTKVIDKKTRQRAFDIHRSQRLHWVKYHINEKKEDNMLCFSVKEPEGIRTYVYDKDEKYVIVLEPKHNNTIYYLLTAYHLRGKDAQRNKILRKYKRRLHEVL
jgi:hypothetical protein